MATKTLKRGARAPRRQAKPKLFELLALDSTLNVMDVGAAAISEVPIYKRLIDLGHAHLFAFDGDARQIAQIEETYGKANVTVLNNFLFDGTKRDVHLCAPLSGMTSLYKPREDALAFFNGFTRFGAVQEVAEVQTTRLNDLEAVPPLDFIKMDTQGAELEILKHGQERTADCLGLQLEVSFVPLYEGQPSFGEVDLFMRAAGYVPHSFVDVKRWSIAPTIFDNNFRKPGNQLLEADIIYIKDPLRLDLINTPQLVKFAALAHYAFRSLDLCVYLLIELERRGAAEAGAHQSYAAQAHRFT